MENANKAIIMAFGMLVAVMILSTIAFVFTRLKALPTQDDEIESVEQLQKFNQEYEVYDKKIMYGVDVISVLNKAKSNNEKYVKGNFLSGNLYNTDYIINIVVTLKTPLNEEIKIKYLSDTQKDEENPEVNTRILKESEYASGGPKPTVKLKEVFTKSRPSKKYQTMIYGSDTGWDNLDFKVMSEPRVEAGIYQLLSHGSKGKVTSPYKPDDNGVTNYTDSMIEGDSTLKEILSQSTNMSITVKNTGTNLYYDATKNIYGWSQATWYPAIYNLKTKKFKCEGQKLTYNSKTGRICYMEFTEI